MTERDVRSAIRVKAIAIIRRPAPCGTAGDLLLSFAIDPDTGERYGRFLGGGVEFGERAEDALRRELREEIGVELGELRQLGVVENVFVAARRQIHEVIFVFAAVFADAAHYERTAFGVAETVCDGPAVWVAGDRLQRGEVRVYPPELLPLL